MFRSGLTTLENLSNFAKDKDDLRSTGALTKRGPGGEGAGGGDLCERRDKGVQRAAEVDAEYDAQQWTKPIVAGEWSAMRTAHGEEVWHD